MKEWWWLRSSPFDVSGELRKVEVTIWLAACGREELGSLTAPPPTSPQHDLASEISPPAKRSGCENGTG